MTIENNEASTDKHLEDFKRIINQHCQALEWHIHQRSDTQFSLDFDMGEGRSQQVQMFLQVSGSDRALVEVSSAVMNLKGLPEQKLGQEMALRLLRENATRPFGNWALDKNGDDTHLVATSRWLLDELDKEELQLSTLVVSAMADAMEAQMGVDHY